MRGCYTVEDEVLRSIPQGEVIALLGCEWFCRESRPLRPFLTDAKTIPFNLILGKQRLELYPQETPRHVLRSSSNLL